MPEYQGTPRGDCRFCHKPVRSFDTAAFKVRGYEVERSQGGANAILGREREPDWIAHEVCLREYLRRGEQGSLNV